MRDAIIIAALALLYWSVRSAHRSVIRIFPGLEAVPVVRIIWTMVIWAIGVVFLPIIARGLIQAGHPVLGVIVAAWTPAVAWPWWLARSFTIPLGVVGPSQFLARMSTMNWGADRDSGQLVAAMLASERRRADARSIRFDGALPTYDITGSAVVAHAILAAQQGETGSARALFDAALWFPHRTTDLAARALATEWLLADAIARGEFEIALDVAARGHWTRRVSFLTAAAHRLSAGGGSDIGLRLRWLLAPGRPVHRPLLQRALARSPGEPNSAPAVDLAAVERGLAELEAASDEAPAVELLIRWGHLTRRLDAAAHVEPGVAAQVFEQTSGPVAAIAECLYTARGELSFGLAVRRQLYPMAERFGDAQMVKALRNDMALAAI